MRTLIIAMAAILAGCAGQPTLPTETKIPVAVPCLSESVKKPDFITDADLIKLGDYDFVVTIAKDRKEREGYELLLEAALSGCM